MRKARTGHTRSRPRRAGAGRSAGLARSARRRSEFLAEASALLAQSLDYGETLARIAAIAVPQMADWCVVTVLRPDGLLRRVAVVHRDPARAHLADSYLRSFPPEAHREDGVMARVTRGESVLIPAVRRGDLEGVAQSPEHLEVMLGLGVTSLIAVPMRTPRRMMGAITYVLSRRGEAFGAVDLAVAQDLAGRAAAAIENALLYEDARSARAGLERAVHARDEFLAVASHELRTPISSMLLAVQGLLRLRHGGGETVRWDQLGRRLEIIENQVGRMQRLIDNLLDVSRLASGRLQLDLVLADVDLAALVRDAALRVRDEAERARCALVLSVDGPCVGRWDRLRLEQVLSNLLSNAFKYGAGKPVEVTLACAPEAALVRVRDHGIGIAPEDHERVFQRFERAVLARDYAGLGLGLWICRQIAEALGGRIDVASAPGAGAEFSVTLPRR